MARHVWGGRWINLLASSLALATAIACGGERTPEAPVFKDTNPLPEEPMVMKTASIGTHGGRFVLAQTVGPKSFNAMIATETSTSDLTDGRLYTSLVEFDNESQQLREALAKSWEQSADGLTWTFHLRRGAKFSDGRSITSADILFNFEVAYDPVVHPPVQDLLLMNGKKWEISAPDEYTVVIKTPARNSMVPALAGSMYIMPKHILEPEFRAGRFSSAYNVSTPPEKLVTSGPWVLKQFVPNEKTVLTRNPHWFGVDAETHRLPYLDELIFLIVPDQDAADLKFRAGEVDAVDDVKPENYRWYVDNQQSGNFTFYELGPSLNTNFFWFNMNKVRKAGVAGKQVGDTYVDPVKYKWFSNVVFRRAVSMAVDRDAMIKSIFFGDAVKNFMETTAGNKVWHNPDIIKFDYNPDEARKLLASLKWADKNGDGFLEDTSGNSINFTLKTNSSNKLRLAMANFIRDDLAKVGIKMTLVPVEFNSLITNIHEDFQYDVALLGLQTGVPPDPALGQNVYRSSGRSHYWNVEQTKPETPEEARIDALMDVLISESDMEKRKKAWYEIATIMNEQAWLGWLPTLTYKAPVRNRFGNAHPSIIPHRLIWNIDRVYVKRSQG